ncbi:TPA: hypothetical protein N2883_004524 [Vibrio parahaemolyticus]|nr:hypothetical protein [Vibrio parahaemolyticus]
MKRRSYKLEWFLLFIAVTFSLISVFGDYLFVGFNWFARSGAILVLIGAVVEYRVSSHIYEDIQRVQFQQSKISLPVPLKGKPTKNRKKIQIAAHTVIVFGTLIWGYGDLVWL